MVLLNDNKQQLGIVKQLLSSHLFAGLPPELLEAIVQKGKTVLICGGEMLLEKGGEGDCAYLIVSGRLQVLGVDDKEGEIILSEPGRGEWIGETLLITGEKPSAPVRAMRDSQLLQLSRTDFNQLIEKYPLILKQVARFIVHRCETMLHPAYKKAKTPPRSFAILPAGSSSPFKSFSEQLVSSLSKHGKGMLVDRACIESRFQKNIFKHAKLDTLSESLFLDWATELELKFDYVIYQADETLTEWTKKCLRQADLILFVGIASFSSALNEVESHFFQHKKQNVCGSAELVLLHPARHVKPSGTREWLEPRSFIARHHHIVPTEKADMARFVRIITGKAIGLVLGGGGGWCLSQVGVISALLESKIPIDMVGGVSGGAMVGGLYALQLSFAKWLEEFPTLLRESNPFRALTIPTTSFFNSSKYDIMLHQLLGDALIEDLWLNFFAISADISIGEKVIHRFGSLWRTCRASGSIPGIFEPAVENGHFLVDGSVIDNLPIETMEQAGAGIILAVDLIAEKDFLPPPASKKYFSEDRNASGYD